MASRRPQARTRVDQTTTTVLAHPDTAEKIRLIAKARGMAEEDLMQELAEKKITELYASLRYPAFRREDALARFSQWWGSLLAHLDAVYNSIAEACDILETSPLLSELINLPGLCTVRDSLSEAWSTMANCGPRFDVPSIGTRGDLLGPETQSK